MAQRHPHVFGNAVVPGSGEVLTRWDEIKKWEKAGKGWTEAYLPDSIEMRYEDENGVVLSCGVRARKALFYKAFAGSYFLSGSVKNRHFLRKWCSKWCSKKSVGHGKNINKRCGNLGDLINLIV